MKKKVTAPLTYDPGKGRPKEHLAYLNWQEMQELQRINGGNVERGPVGLPSFPPKGAMSGNSARSPAATSNSKGAGSKSTGGGMRSGPGATGGGKTPARASSYGRTVESSRGNGGTKTSAQKAGMNARDAQFKQVAESTRASSALKKSPAANTDLSKGGIKTLNVGPMGTPVKVKSGIIGGQIKGAISRTADAPVKSPMSGQGSSFNSALDARIDTFQRINDARLATKKVFEGTTPRAPQGVFGPRVPAGTGYLRTATMPGMITTGMTSPYAGVAPPRFNAEQTLRAYEEGKRASVKDQSRLPTTSPNLPSLSRPSYETGYTRYRSVTPAAPPLPSITRPAYDARGLASLTRPSYETSYTPVPANETIMREKTGPKMRVTDAPPYAGAERVLSVENVPVPFSDTGVMRPVSPYTPKAPAYQFAGDQIGADFIGGLGVQGTESSFVGAEPPNPSGLDALDRDRFYGAYDISEEDTSFGVPGPETPTTDFVDEYPRVDTKEKISPLGPRSYDTPYPTDEYGTPIQNVSADDLAKIRTRRRGEEYVPTPKEKRAIQAGKIVTRVITSRIPGLNKVIDTEEKMKDFYSRPSWEQEYIAQRASDWAAIRGDRKVTAQEAEEIEQRTGRGISKFTGGGIGDLGGRGGDDVYSDIVKDVPKVSEGVGGAEPAAVATSARPYVYYEWDLGINVPSPGEPKYTEYQKYLKERADAQKALGLV